MTWRYRVRILELKLKSIKKSKPEVVSEVHQQVLLELFLV